VLLAAALGALSFAAPGDGVGFAATGVVLTSRTVVVPPALVKQELVKVVGQGSEYEFRGDPAPLSSLGPGKVLLLEGLDAGVVTGLRHVSGNLVVDTTPATLTDIVRSGTIAAAGKPDFAAGHSLPDPPGVAITWQDTSEKTSGFNYKFGVNAATDGLHIVGVGCYHFIALSGSSCSNHNFGVGLAMELDALLNFARFDAVIDVSDSKVTGGSFRLYGVDGKWKIAYTGVRGDGNELSGTLPVIRLPFYWEFPIPNPWEIPLYMKVQLAFLAHIAFASKNSFVEGGYQEDFKGSDTLNGSTAGSGKPTVSGSGTNALEVEGVSEKPFVSPGAAAVAFAFQVRLGPGFGVRNANVLYYFSAVDSMGEVTGSQVALQDCATMQQVVTFSGNWEAQLEGFRFTGAPVTFGKPFDLSHHFCR
jgi:hypothetical protein